MQTVSFKLPDDLVADLEREAKARRVTKSVLVRRSLEAALRQRRAASCFDLAQDLAGSVKGLPRDLAHDPKYIDGFGDRTGRSAGYSRRRKIFQDTTCVEALSCYPLWVFAASPRGHV